MNLKKYLLVLLIILLFSSSSQAMEKEDKVEFRGSFNYSNYIYKYYDIKIKDGSTIKMLNDNFIREDLHQGTGYYGELVYWFNHKLALGVGLRKNNMVAEWSTGSEGQNNKYTSQLDSYYTKIIYSVNPNWSPYLNINYNKYKEHFSGEGFDSDMRRGDGLGLMLGVVMTHPINQRLSFILDMGYYMNNIDITEKYSNYKYKVIDIDNEELKMKGLVASIGLAYKF